MALKVGDKCPQCKQGLLERNETGIECSQCDFEMEIEEVVKANERSKMGTEKYQFKSRTFKITIDDPEEAEQFIRGCILANQNVNCALFGDLLDATNAIMEPYRAAKLEEQLAARGS